MMKKYGKSLLSLVTVMALSATANASGANYIKFTDAASQGSWVLFGVNGYKVDGEQAASTTLTLPDTAIDSAKDENAVPLLNGGHTYAEIKLQNVSENALSSFEIAMDLSGETYSETEPLRTMYVEASGLSGLAAVSITYKASLEGKKFEYIVDGGTTVYAGTLDYTKNFTNPAVRTTRADDSVTGVELKKVTDVLDYNLLNNPQDPTKYLKADHLDTIKGTTRAYTYDGVNSSWLLYDAANVASTNDFDEFQKGKGYWINNDLGADGDSGAVLGTSGLVDGDYNNTLVEGWNLLSFDGAKPLIRSASTGITVIDNGNTGTITITDASGKNSVSVTLPGTSTAVDAKKINRTIAQYKAAGTVPETFDVVVYPSVGATSLTFVSNEMFSLTDDANDELGAAASLAGLDLWSAGAAFAAGTAIGTTAVESVYGEYALIVEPLTESAAIDPTSGANPSTAKVQFNKDETNFVNYSQAATTPTLAQIKTQYDAYYTAVSSTIKGKATDISIDSDTTANELLILASDTPFSIRDYTFTRVYKFRDFTSGTISVQGATSKDVTAVTDIGTVVTNINAVAADTELYAKVDAGDTIVLVGATNGTQHLDLRDDATTDNFNEESSTNNIAKGAIASVYSVDNLANATVTPNKVTFALTLGQEVDDATDTYQIEFDGTSNLGDSAYGTVVLGSANADTIANYLADMEDRIQKEALAQGLDVRVSDDADGTETTIAGITITLEGYGFDAANINFVTNGTNPETDLPSTLGTTLANIGKVSVGAKLTTDLKYNSLYAPDYAVDGPVYTMKAQGYSMESIVAGTTKLSDKTVAWDSLDLTVAPSKWFDNHNFNLFSIDGEAGYWVYLVPNTDANEIAVSNISIEPSYTYRFNSFNNKTKNDISANISVDIAGLPSDKTSVNVYATVGGSNIQLLGDAAGTYTGVLDTFELKSLSRDTTQSISIAVSDGLGYKYSDANLSVLDYTKPSEPEYSLNYGNNIELNSTSSDVKAYYIFEGNIPEKSTSTASNMVGKVQAEDATSYNLCQSDKFTFATTASLKAIAMDGTAYTNTVTDGELGIGNASDALAFNYEPTLKGAYVLTHTDDGSGTLQKPSADAVEYNTSCSSTGLVKENGISVKSLVTDKTIKVSYSIPSGETTELKFGTNIPNTIYIGVGGTTSIAQLKYVAEYAGETVYVQYNSTLYKVTLPANDNTNGTSGTPLDITGTTVTGQLLP